MAMTNEEFKELMTKLLNPELTLEERTELQLSVEKHNGEVTGELEEAKSKNTKLQTNLDDALVTANRLYRETGFAGGSENEDQPKVVSHDDLLREDSEY